MIGHHSAKQKRLLNEWRRLQYDQFEAGKPLDLAPSKEFIEQVQRQVDALQRKKVMRLGGAELLAFLAI